MCYVQLELIYYQLVVCNKRTQPGQPSDMTDHQTTTRLYFLQFSLSVQKEDHIDSSDPEGTHQNISFEFPIFHFNRLWHSIPLLVNLVKVNKSIIRLREFNISSSGSAKNDSKDSSINNIYSALRN